MAYKSRFFPNLSDKKALAQIADLFHMQIMQDVPQFVHDHVLNFLRERGKVRTEKTVLFTVIQDGYTSVERHIVTAHPDRGWEIPVSDNLVLITNGEQVMDKPYGKEAKTLVDTLESRYHDRTAEYFAKQPYNTRVRVVMESFFALYPKGTLDGAVAECKGRYCCGDTNPDNFPERMGIQYAKYIRQCQRNGKEAKYILSLASFIKNGRYLEDHDNEPELSLDRHSTEMEMREMFIAI